MIGLLLIALILISMPVYQRWISGNKTPLQSPQMQRREPIGISTGDTTKQNDISEKGTNEKKNLSKIQPDTSKTPVLLIPFKTTKLSGTIITKGGDILSLKLNGIYDYMGNTVELAPNLSRKSNSDVELVVGEQKISLDDVFFVADKESVSLLSKDIDTLTLNGALSDGSTVQKQYIFYRDEHHIGYNLSVSLSDTSRTVDEVYVWYKSGLLPTEVPARDDLNNFGFIYKIGKEIGFGKPSRKNSEFSLDGSGDWVAVKSKYFAVALLTDPPLSAQGIRTSTQWLQSKVFGGEATVPAIAQSLYFRPVSSKFMRKLLIYAGPRDSFILKKYGRNFERIADLGWWWLAPITQFFLWLFKILYSLVSNYGWVIVIFTVIMKIVLLPLSHGQLKSMKVMKSLAPKLKVIQEQYREDPKKLQLEMMKVYKKHGVNPLSGCLPTIAQLPVFLALYRVLASSFQIRGQPFIFWIHDLSKRDPYLILPILMTLLMFVQQKFTVTDPRQKMMGYIIPIIFFVFFYSLPAGLVLYWTVFNFLSIIHMVWVERRWQAPVVEEVKEKNTA